MKNRNWILGLTLAATAGLSTADEAPAAPKAKAKAVRKAPDRATLLKRAKKLEKRAGQLLDRGRKDEALDLIFEAADLRAAARKLPAPTATTKPQPVETTKPAPKDRRAAKGEMRKQPVPKTGGPAVRKGPNLRSRILQTNKRLQAAVAAKNAPVAATEAKRLQALMTAWAKQTAPGPSMASAAAAAHEKKLRARITRLERQVAEIRQILAKR